MTAQQLYDLLADLQDDGLNLSDIHLAYPSQNPGTVHERIEHTEIVQLPDEITNTKAGVLKGVRPTEIVFMTADDKKIYLELLNTEFAPVMVAAPGEGAVIVDGVKDCDCGSGMTTCWANDCLDPNRSQDHPTGLTLPESKLHLPSRGIVGHEKLIEDLRKSEIN